MSHTEKAAELYAGGASVNAVSKALGITWVAAKALKPGGAAAQKRGRRAAGASDDPDETWDLTIQIPGAHLGAILEKCSAQEKARAVQAVLQGRMDTIVSAVAE